MLVPVTVSLGMALVYQGQLPAACRVKESSSEVVMSWVLPPALTTCWVFTGPAPAESDIVTWWPPGIGVTSTTFLVSRACALLMLVTTWYTQVSPTATGNGI